MEVVRKGSQACRVKRAWESKAEASHPHSTRWREVQKRSNQEAHAITDRLALSRSVWSARDLSPLSTIRRADTNALEIGLRPTAKINRASRFGGRIPSPCSIRSSVVESSR